MCQQHKKPVPRSTVGLSKANFFNDTDIYKSITEDYDISKTSKNTF